MFSKIAESIFQMQFVFYIPYFDSKIRRYFAIVNDGVAKNVI